MQKDVSNTASKPTSEAATRAAPKTALITGITGQDSA
jgi:hypothetical protein